MSAGGGEQRGVRAAVPILTYHSLDGSGSVISTSPDLFRFQMETLKARGYQGVALGRVLDGWLNRAALPARPVALTFDDGYRNVLTEGVPALRALGFGATMFALAGRAGLDNGWSGQPASIPRLPLLGWGELRELAAAGVEMGAHGLDHTALPKLSDADAEREMADGRSILEEKLGVKVRLFAYAYGAAEARERALALRHFDAACGVTLRAARPDDDRAELPRIDAYYLRPRSALRAFGTPAGRLYLGARALVRALRRAF